jgi:hypothetical protein
MNDANKPVSLRQAAARAKTRDLSRGKCFREPKEEPESLKK